jgi:hypothetical protein
MKTISDLNSKLFKLNRSKTATRPQVGGRTTEAVYKQRAMSREQRAEHQEKARRS